MHHYDFVNTSYQKKQIIWAGKAGIVDNVVAIFLDAKSFLRTF